MTNIKDYKVESEELTKILVENQFDYVLELSPAIYVNFDRQELISLFPEPASYEEYVPDGWKGTYGDFTSEIPVNLRYWVIDGENYLAKNYE